MQKTLFETKNSRFEITWHPNFILLGVVKDDDDLVIVLFQIAFIFNLKRKKRKK